MLKHLNKANETFPYEIAAYPLSWRKYVISPQKICIQFTDVQCKTRAPGSKIGLNRTNHGTWSLPIDTNATNIAHLNLGVPLRMYPELIQNIISAIKEHDKLHEEHSIKQEVIKLLKDFIAENEG